MRTRRARELAALVVAGIAVAVAWGSVFLAQRKTAEWEALAWGGIFLALMLVLHLIVRSRLPEADPWLLPAAALLTGLGITMVSRIDADLASRQTAWLVLSLGLVAALVIGLRDHHVLERYRYLIGAASVLLLLLPFLPVVGQEIRGARLWIRVGSMQMQPGEFAKLGMVIFLAAYLRDHRELLSLRLGSATGRALGPLLLFWGGAMVLLVAMNDFGTSLLFYGSFLLLVYVATGRAWYVGTGLGAFAAGAAAVYRIAPHVRQRFDVWLDPWQDPQGSGYQLVQGLFALADGGVAGRGLGRAYLVTADGTPLIPDVHTDFIFAALADELGFVGAAGVLVMYVLIAWRGCLVAASCRDGFSKLLAFGLSAVFALQAIVITGGIVRLLPLTGQTLPFVSYGGSSLLANWLLVGLLLVISHRAVVERESGAGGVRAVAPARAPLDGEAARA